jgi:hypothetical protein
VISSLFLGFAALLCVRDDIMGGLNNGHISKYRVFGSFLCLYHILDLAALDS